MASLPFPSLLTASGHSGPVQICDNGQLKRKKREEEDGRRIVRVYVTPGCMALALALANGMGTRFGRFDQTPRSVVARSRSRSTCICLLLVALEKMYPGDCETIRTSLSAQLSSARLGPAQLATIYPRRITKEEEEEENCSTATPKSLNLFND